MDYQKQDFEMMGEMWKMLREYGNLTNAPEDEDRWHEFMILTDAFEMKYPNTRGLMREFRFMIQERSVSTNKGVLKIAC